MCLQMPRCCEHCRLLRKDGYWMNSSYFFLSSVLEFYLCAVFNSTEYVADTFTRQAVDAEFCLWRSLSRRPVFIRSAYARAQAHKCRMFDALAEHFCTALKYFVKVYCSPRLFNGKTRMQHCSKTSVGKLRLNVKAFDLFAKPIWFRDKLFVSRLGILLTELLLNPLP